MRIENKNVNRSIRELKRWNLFWRLWQGMFFGKCEIHCNTLISIFILLAGCDTCLNVFLVIQ